MKNYLQASTWACQNRWIFTVVFGMGISLSIASVVHAVSVDVELELYLATDVSGSILEADFNFHRQGVIEVFTSAAVINSIEATSNGIAVKLVDFATSTVTAVDWFHITDAATAQDFAALVLAASRGEAGTKDGQSNLINVALADLNSNDFDGRQVIDIVSEGAQDIDGCMFNNDFCPSVQVARKNFLERGGTAINALWLNDRDFFGLDADDRINAFEYGSRNVIGGQDAFQLFADDFTVFRPVLEQKVLREINVNPAPAPAPVPEPGTIFLLGTGLAGLILWRWRNRQEHY